MRDFDRYERGAEVLFGNGLRLFGGLLILLVIAAIVATVIWLVTRNRTNAATSVARFDHLGDDPLKLAAARYASGDIDRDQFEQIRTDLLTTTPATDTPPGDD